MADDHRGPHGLVPPSTPVISHAQASSAAARVRANCYRSLHTWTGTARRANPSEKGVPDLATPTARRQIRGRCGPCVGGAAPQDRSAQDSRRGRAEQQGPCADEALRLTRRSVALRRQRGHAAAALRIGRQRRRGRQKRRGWWRRRGDPHVAVSAPGLALNLREVGGVESAEVAPVVVAAVVVVVACLLYTSPSPRDS